MQQEKKEITIYHYLQLQLMKMKNKNRQLNYYFGHYFESKHFVFYFLV
jgi:hypothetical protein